MRLTSGRTLINVRPMPQSAQPPAQQFADALTGLGGRSRHVADTAAAADAIEEIVRAHSETRRLLFEPDPLISSLGLPLALSARGVSLVDVADAGDAGELTVGLTCAELAVARSGTLLVGGEPGGWGLAAALPRVHIALVREADIEPELSAAFPRFAEQFAKGKKNWVWISGPSKTADIAMQLVTGVHGPNALEVLVVGEPG
ncbi:MAG: hypothetical protein GKS06_08435 [Acidobacteria bacterium]|nr:hypothetical protein [Acidobacteriota bacterium]